MPITIIGKKLAFWEVCEFCDGEGQYWRYDSVGNMTDIPCSTCPGEGGFWMVFVDPDDPSVASKYDNAIIED